MIAMTDRLDFAPPAQPGRLRSMGLALLAHAALLAALSLGVQWKRQSQDFSVEAELWAAVPREAAPKPPEAPPPQPPPLPAAEPVPQPAPAPLPVPAKPAPAPPEPAARSKVDIALAQEKKRKEKERLKQAQIEEDRNRQEKLHQASLAKEAQRLQALREQERLEAQSAKQIEALRLEQTKRMAKLATPAPVPSVPASSPKPTPTPAPAPAPTPTPPRPPPPNPVPTPPSVAPPRPPPPNPVPTPASVTPPPAPPVQPAITSPSGGSGNTQQAAGPSSSYVGRLKAKLYPNITFLEEKQAQISGNPQALVSVKASADGSITERTLIKSSGVTAWDDAVLKGFDKMETMPRDVDGRVPPWLNIGIEYRP